MLTGIIALAILLPTGANPVTTPLTCVQGMGTEGHGVNAQVIACMPEESPEGGYPDGWRDNSPTYTDGWMLQVNDSTHRVDWIAPTQEAYDRLPGEKTNEYGAGAGALCGTDAQCAAYSRSIGEEPSGYASGK